MPQLNNATNAPFPLSPAQGGSGLNANLQNLQFVMGGDNGPQVTRIFPGLGMNITYDATNCYFTNPAAWGYPNVGNGDYGIYPTNFFFANCPSGGTCTIYPQYQRSDYNKSARILGLGAGFFTLYNPGGMTIYCGNQQVKNQIVSTAIGDCVEIIFVNSTTCYFNIQQGNFTIS